MPVIKLPSDRISIPKVAAQYLLLPAYITFIIIMGVHATDSKCKLHAVNA